MGFPAFIFFFYFYFLLFLFDSYGCHGFSFFTWGMRIRRRQGEKENSARQVPGNGTEWMMSSRGQRHATQLFSVITGYNDISYGPASVGCHNRAAVWLKLSVAIHACTAFLELMSCTMQKRPTRFRALAGFALCRRFQHPSTVSTMVLPLAVTAGWDLLFRIYV